MHFVNERQNYMAENDVTVEVAYATPTHQYLVTVTLPMPSTVLDAIIAADITALCPEIDLSKQRIGIFGKWCTLSHVLCSGDRVEIYRPLLIDPKIARRTRAKKSC